MMSLERRIVLFIVCLLVCGWNSPGSSAGSQPHRTGTFLLHADIVADGTATRSWLRVEQGLIKEISATKPNVGDEYQTVEFDGYAFPSFIDTHNHIPWNCVPRWNGGHWANRY